MQANGALRGDTTIPRPRRLRALLAIVVIAALVALLIWAAPFAASGGGAEVSNPSAGSAIVHDDVGNTNRYRPRHRSVTHFCTCAGGKILYGKYKSARLRVMAWESPRGE
jgi:hypothetical protein